jgi:hypothetical protein
MSARSGRRSPCGSLYCEQHLRFPHRDLSTHSVSRHIEVQEAQISKRRNESRILLLLFLLLFLRYRLFGLLHCFLKLFDRTHRQRIQSIYFSTDPYRGAVGAVSISADEHFNHILGPSALRPGCSSSVCSRCPCISRLGQTWRLAFLRSDAYRVVCCFDRPWSCVGYRATDRRAGHGSCVYSDPMTRSAGNASCFS